MNKRILVVCDIDGTLLNPQHQLDQFTIDTFKKLNQQRSDVIICLATGRSWEETKKIYQQLSLNTVTICCNSCQIVNYTDSNFKPRHFTFDRSFLVEILSDPVFIDDMEWTSLITVDQNYLFKSEKEIQQFLNQNFHQCHHEIVYIRTKFKCKSSVNYLFGRVKKIAANLLIQCWEYANKEIYFMEIGVPYATKKLGIEFLASYYNVDYRNIYLFGDNINDITMLQMPCNTYALASGINQAKIYAKHITEKGNDQCGVANELIKIFNIK